MVLDIVPGLLLHRQDRKYPVETYSLLHQNQSDKPELVRRLPCGIRYRTLNLSHQVSWYLYGGCPCGIRYRTLNLSHQVNRNLYGGCPVVLDIVPGLLLHRQDRKYPVETYSLLHENQSGKLVLVRRLPCGIRYCTSSEPTGKLTLCMGNCPVDLDTVIRPNKADKLAFVSEEPYEYRRCPVHQTKEPCEYRRCPVHQTKEPYDTDVVQYIRPKNPMNTDVVQYIRPKNIMNTDVVQYIRPKNPMNTDVVQYIRPK